MDVIDITVTPPQPIRTVAVGNSVNYGAILNKPTSFPPSAHASTHAKGGSDPITPASIGASTIQQAVALAIALG